MNMYNVQSFNSHINEKYTNQIFFFFFNRNMSILRLYKFFKNTVGIISNVHYIKLYSCRIITQEFELVLSFSLTGTRDKGIRVHVFRQVIVLSQ